MKLNFTIDTNELYGEDGEVKMKKPLIILAIMVICMVGVALAEEKIIYYCPECRSENIEIVCLFKPQPPRIVKRSMDEIADDDTWNAVLVWYPWEARCKDCGYVHKFSRPWFR